MKNAFTYDAMAGLKGKDVCSSDGEKIGTVKDIFYDADTRTPEWIGLGSGFLGLKEVVVPLDGASFEGDIVRVGYPKKVVQDEPDFDEKDGILTSDSERRLCDYFGVTGHDTIPHSLNRFDSPTI